jgi:ribosome-binding factor A
MPKKLIKNNDEMERLAGTAREGDGVDPREEAKLRQRERRQRRDGSTCGVHRQERFGSQVRDAIDSALLSASNPILNVLAVREVVQEGGALLVVVVPRDPLVPVDTAAANKALAGALPMLRREVATAITRKEIPSLRFVALPSGAEKIGE